MKAPRSLRERTSTIDDMAAGRPSVLCDGSGKRRGLQVMDFSMSKECESV